MRQRVTMQDVADHVGVSLSTASLALSGKGRVAPGTRAQVHAAAEELHFQINLAARNFRAARRGAVGLYLPDNGTTSSYFMDVVSGAASRAQEDGVSLMMVPPQHATTDATQSQLDAMIIVDPVSGDSEAAALLAEARIPVITGDRVPKSMAKPASYTCFDYQAATFQLLEHLKEQGSTRYSLLAAEPNSVWTDEVTSAFHQWNASQNSTATSCVTPANSSPSEIVEITRTMLSTHRSDSLIVLSEHDVPAALTAINTLGLRLGSDLLLASYVDSASLQFHAPPITALNLHPRDVGRICMELALTGRTAPVEVPIELVTRPSSLRSLAGARSE